MGLGPGSGLMSQRLFRSPLSPFPDWPAEHEEEDDVPIVKKISYKLLAVCVALKALYSRHSNVFCSSVLLVCDW